MAERDAYKKTLEGTRARLQPYTVTEGFNQSEYAPGIAGTLDDIGRVLT